MYALERLPERTVEPARELGGITHEGASVAKAGIDQAPFYCSNPTVHHIARCNAMCACAHVVERDLGEACNGGLGVDRSIGVEKSTVTVRGVLTETYVTRDVERGEERPDLSDSLDDRSFGIIRWGSTVILGEEGRV